MKKLTIGISILIALLMLSMFAVIPQAKALPTDLTVLSGDRIGEPMDIDPAWAYDTSSGELLMNIYDSLLWFNRTDGGTFIPRLATSWTITPIDVISPEGLHWLSRVTFTIRTGVHFQDLSPHSSIPGAGALLTPQDVEYSLERVLVTDAGTGPSWMLWDPFMATANAYALNTTLKTVGTPAYDANGFDTRIGPMIDHAVESDATTVTCNLVMPYQPFLGIVAQTWGDIVSQAWCVWHNDWPGFDGVHLWSDWHDPLESPLYVGAKGDTSSGSGIRINAALGTGPYLLDYWNKGAGNSWSIIKNDPSVSGVGSTYWEGWSTPGFRHVGWGSAAPTIDGHVDRYTSYYIAEWSTRRLRFLGGLTDFCDVPRNYMGQVLGQPGIQCMAGLAQLAVDACFFNFAVSGSSTYMGVMQPASTFNQYGAPPNIMEDIDFRLAMAHMFDYTTFLYAAFLNESIAPVSPIIPGLAYYDPSIGKPQLCVPLPGQLKEYGITGNVLEPAGQKAYDMVLAETYLRAAWGGNLWANGFTFSAVYNEGNVARQIAATLMRDAFNYFNAKYNTHFTINIVSVPWRGYSALWRARVLPYFIVGWLVDYPDAHDFAFPFMHSGGDFSRYQGTKGVTSFPNQAVDDHIAAGIGTTDPVQRQGNYTWLQQYYVNECPGFCTDQVTGRHWQRDWVQGWYYNPIYPGNYIYDLWKAIGTPVQNVDVEITAFTPCDKLEVGYPEATLTVMNTDPISGTVTRLDNTGPAYVVVIIAITLQGPYPSTDEYVVGYVIIILYKPPTGNSANFYFDTFTQDPDKLLHPGLYTWNAHVYVISGFAQNIAAPGTTTVYGPAGGCNAQYWKPDVNGDASCDMADIGAMIDAFMTDKTFPNWNPSCDILTDGTVDFGDISIDLVSPPFMTTFA